MGGIQMSKEYKFSSALSQHIIGFITEKRDCGFKYDRQYRILKSLDKYWNSNEFQESIMTAEALEDWCSLNPNEGYGSLANRISVIREFSKYLCGLGYDSYIPPRGIHYNPVERVPLTSEEIEALFIQIDGLTLNKRASSACKRIVNEYPIIFRLLYLNGMRIEETCSILLEHYDPHKGIITIYDGKGKKDRLIYLADDMNSLCNDYIGYLYRILGNQSGWLFPGYNAQNHITANCVESVFNKCWHRTSFSNTGRKKPVVHDLRHTMIENKINKWVAEGVSFDLMRPYLSTYLGHKTWSETLYYFHNSKETAHNLHSVDTVSKKVIPEVKRL